MSPVLIAASNASNEAAGVAMAVAETCRSVVGADARLRAKQLFEEEQACGAYQQTSLPYTTLEVWGIVLGRGRVLLLLAVLKSQDLYVST